MVIGFVGYVLVECGMLVLGLANYGCGDGGLVLWVECLALSLWWAALFDTIAVMAVFWY